MTPPVRRAVAIAVAFASLLALGGLSRAPYTPDRAEYAVVRLAWRARGDRVEECRRLTPAELERIPPHMRQEERCEGRILPYRLQVSVDGVPTIDELVHAAGARGDRPLYVYREVPLAAGIHPLVITFAREGEVPRGAREDEEGTPSRLMLDTIVTLAARRVLLVTYDDEGRRLVAKTAIPR